MKGPHIDWAGLSPLIAVLGGAIVVLLAGLLRSRFVREALVPFLAIVTLGTFAGLSIWQWDEGKDVISAALRVDTFAMYLNCLLAIAGVAAVLLSWRALAPRESAHGEYYSMLLFSVGGMAVLVASQNTVTLFLGFELLSIPLYVLCATEMRRATSLESGLKYLVIGSVGSATLVYGLALLYGATGSTDFSAMARALGDGSDVAGDSLLLAGVALVIVGLAFKASVAPFHQWTPDVYEGAPTPITAFMAIATKVAAFGVLLRMMDVALLPVSEDWSVVLGGLAMISIVVGNVGALGQSSLKRLLAWSSVAQAGYLLAGVVVASRLGVQATLFYLAVYLVMTLASFAVVIARERETELGDHIDALNGLGWSRPWLAWPLTISMLSLAGIPATGGFIGKIYLLDASVDGGWTWLAIFIVLGSAASLAYYLKVLAAVWMRPATETVAPPAAPVPALAGGSQDLDPPEEPAPADASSPAPDAADAPPPAADAPRSRPHPELVIVAVVAAALTLAAGIYPDPLFDAVREAGTSFRGLL
ncbi:MAG TPA: NADH-quinone oxidoreductase subunit N [Solirubrobacteraceae bacterium]|nr:NADH-quinone oxidoreductase subunit N [Solirubrobacteraceae bacterium]